MQRRHFLGLTALVFGSGSLLSRLAHAAGITDKDMLKEGQPATIANYCENADKKPNKFCPEVKGKCSACMFYNKPTPSEGTYKGKKAAKCQLLTDATKPQYVYADGTCASFVKNP